MVSIEIPDKLAKQVEEAVKKGACCSVKHFITRAVEKELKSKAK